MGVTKSLGMIHLQEMAGCIYILQNSSLTTGRSPQQDKDLPVFSGGCEEVRSDRTP